VAPLVGVRGICARLNGTVAMQIAITPSLINVIWVILFPSIPRRPWFERLIFHPPKYSAHADLVLLRTRRIFQCHARGNQCSLVRDSVEVYLALAACRLQPATAGQKMTCLRALPQKWQD